MDATRPHVVLNGEDLHDIQPDVTPQELREQFAPNASTLRKMKHSQRLRARLRKANNRLSEFDKNEQTALDEEGEEEDKFFPIYADRPGSFQADICFMPENQVFNGYQGIVCLISTNRKIAWATAYRAPRDGMTGHRKRQIRAEQMYPLLVQCIDEMEHRFHIEVKQIESDDENMFKGVCREQLRQRGISQYFVKPSVSGPFKTKLGVVERFNRTIKLFLNKLMVGYNTPNWVPLLPEALYYYNFQHKDRAIGNLRPAEVDDEEEENIASRKAQETVETQDYYDNKHFNTPQPRARIPREIEEGARKEESNNAFKKERPTWSRVPFHISKSVTGPSLNVTHPQEAFPKQRKFLPYNLRWT